MMITAWIEHMVLNALGWDISINDVCVFIPAWFAILTCFFVYLLGKEISGSANVGVISAAVMAIIPAHMMRSVAGGFDNESVAVAIMAATYYLWVRSLRTDNSWPWAFLCAAMYVYAVASWGAYTFVINVIGIHAGVLVLLGRYRANLHHAYSIFWVIGTAGALQFPIVGLQPISSLEQMGPMALFFGLQVWYFIELSRDKYSEVDFQRYRIRVLTICGAIGIVLFAVALQAGYLGAFTHRVRSLFLKHTRTGNALVDSVAEHQATDDGVFFQYFHAVYFLAPVGFVMLFLKPTDAKIFGIVYTLLAYYFSKRMVRLILLLSPPASITAAIAIWWVLDFAYKQVLPHLQESLSGHPAQQAQQVQTPAKESQKKKAAQAPGIFDPLVARFDTPFMRQYGTFILASTLLMIVVWAMFGFTLHSYGMAEGLSHPQIMISTRDREGNMMIIDDFREAYWWVRDNTPQDARIMAWWDYGYQINGIANRTSIADGNTWNFEHIALLGRTLISPEKEVHGHSIFGSFMTFFKMIGEFCHGFKR